MKILVAGDFCPQHRVAELFSRRNYYSVLGNVKPILDKVDYSIVNFECPVSKGNEMPIAKNGPNLYCSEDGIDAVKWVGFDCLTLANNHFLDLGDDGVVNLLNSCYKHGIDVVGGGRNLYDASKILYRTINGKTIGIINCCEHEFSIATNESAGSNPLNPVKQYYAIKEASEKADYTLLIIHGGCEHYQLPSPRMKELYRFFVDIGADAVVNHHQHCFSGYEIYKGKPICYGLGNFCFDNSLNNDKSWWQGILCILEFSSEIKIKLLPYIQCNEKPIVTPCPDDFDITKKINELNDIIIDDARLAEEYNRFMYSTHKKYLEVLEPYSKYLMILKRKGLLPSAHYRYRMLRTLNYLCCESHLERLQKAIEIWLKNHPK